MPNIPAVIQYNQRHCGSGIVAGCTPGEFFFTQESGSCSGCQTCTCDFFSLTDNPPCPSGPGPFIHLVNTGCTSRQYMSIPDFISLLNIQDRLVAINANNTPRYLFEQLEGCTNNSGQPLLSVSITGTAPSQKVRFCIHPQNMEIKITDLKDGPGTYVDCPESAMSWVYHDNQCPSCNSNKCFKAVLTTGCPATGRNRTCPTPLFHAQIRTEIGNQEFVLPAEQEGPIMYIICEKDGHTVNGDSSSARYGTYAGSKTIKVLERKRYNVQAVVQGLNNKYVNSWRVGVYNVTTSKEYGDMKVGGRLNPTSGLLPLDWCSEPNQDVSIYSRSQYLHQMYHSLSYCQDIMLDPGDYLLILKIDTRTDTTGTQPGKVRIVGGNGDTVIQEATGAVFTGLSIREIVPAYYSVKN